MKSDERDMLIRIDEQVSSIMSRHMTCGIPRRIACLEQKKDRIEGMVAVCLVLVALGRISDIFEWIRQLAYGL